MKNNDIKFETLKKPIRKKIIIGSLVAVAIVSAITLNASWAKYRLTQSMPVVRGKIYYYNGDLNVMAMYQQKDGSTCIDDSCYNEITGRMPTGNYAINETKSYCKIVDTKDTEAKLYSKYVDGKWEHIISNLQKKDKCYLYFDKKVPSVPASTIISNIKSKSNGTKSSFSELATTNEGIFQISDGMYGGTSYYWRGAVTDNHVIFANYCWRIIRINGDGTIRMIYNGAVQSGNTCLGNGANGTNVEIGKSAYHATDNNQSYYVGWTYNSSQRPSTSINNGSVGTTNTIKSFVETWYSTNITNKGYDGKVASGKYCNDREVGIGGDSTTWSATGTGFYYAAYTRINNNSPTLSCSNNGDIYQVKVGLITADEVMYAGGKYNSSNTSYYLYSGSWYWTMSPGNWVGWFAYVLYVRSNGLLFNSFTGYNGGVDYADGGVRPVINLSTSATFESGSTGEANSPYKVSQ